MATLQFARALEAYEIALKLDRGVAEISKTCEGNSSDSAREEFLNAIDQVRHDAMVELVGPGKDVTDLVISQIAAEVVTPSSTRLGATSRWIAAGAATALTFALPTLPLAGAGSIWSYWAVAFLLLCLLLAVVCEWLAVPLMSAAEMRRAMVAATDLPSNLNVDLQAFTDFFIGSVNLTV
ncbi:MAG: hypothetical protein ABI583_05835 [Betaproteobacteria bacterium]